MKDKKTSSAKLPAEFYEGGFIDISELNDTKPSLLANLESDR